MRRLPLLLLLTAVLAVLAASSMAQDPFPLPQEDEGQGLRYERTPEDIAAILALESSMMRDIQRAGGLRIPSHVQMPLTIRVGIVNTALYINNCSRWVQDGMPIVRVDTVDFKEYVRNVLPNEWVYTWHAESLKAGALAAKMFAWWRYNILEQYPQYRPQGVHVVNNVCDQVYIPGSARPSTNAAVDATWPDRMTDPNDRVVEIHYLAWDWQCANAYSVNGGGWYRCMGQNESAQLANAGWTYKAILQRYYTPVQFTQTKAMPAAVNVLRNGTFDAALSYWFTTGGVGGASVSGGALRLFSASGAETPGQVYQDVDLFANANSPLQVVVKLGNPTDTPRSVRVRVRSTASATGSFFCTFSVPPNTPLMPYTIRGANPAVWSGLRVVIAAQDTDGLDGVLVDDVVFKLAPKANLALPCLTPPPGKPTIVSPADGGSVRSPFAIDILPGATNHAVGYAPAWHVQVDDQSNFSSPLYDNAAALSSEPRVVVETGSGTWYIRVRQYDGVERYSPWVKATVYVSALPAAPLQLAPIGDVPMSGQSFVWMTSNLADRYALVIRDAAGNLIYRQARTPQAWGCSISACSVPLESLGVFFGLDTPYSWRVNAINANGRGMSPFGSFRLIDVPPVRR